MNLSLSFQLQKIDLSLDKKNTKVWDFNSLKSSINFDNSDWNQFFKVISWQFLNSKN